VGVGALATGRTAVGHAANPGNGGDCADARRAGGKRAHSAALPGEDHLQEGAQDASEERAVSGQGEADPLGEGHRPLPIWDCGSTRSTRCAAESAILRRRLRKDGADITLDVLYRVVRGTIDERLYRTVKMREKWLEFLLGAAPDFAEYRFGDEDPPPLPERLGEELSIDLGPT